MLYATRAMEQKEGKFLEISVLEATMEELLEPPLELHFNAHSKICEEEIS